MALTAVLLAGGESRRMGREKAIAEWRGRQLWEWQLEKLRALQPEKILLSARSDRPWRPTNVELVLDAAPSCGPLSGLAAALARTETEHMLVLAIDMPFMTTRHLESLCTFAAAQAGVLPMIDDRAEPLAALYPAEARTDFERALGGANYSLQPLVCELAARGKLRIVQISEGDRARYKSVNVPGDLEG
jgi:molybdopterin-guanine dinucleotide biosynthesis protein A